VRDQRLAALEPKIGEQGFLRSAFLEKGAESSDLKSRSREGKVSGSNLDDR